MKVPGLQARITSLIAQLPWNPIFLPRRRRSSPRRPPCVRRFKINNVARLTLKQKQNDNTIEPSRYQKPRKWTAIHRYLNLRPDVIRTISINTAPSESTGTACLILLFSLLPLKTVGLGIKRFPHIYIWTF